jgi:hypothetical protein
MEYQTYYVSKNVYSIELKHKVGKEHIDDGIRLADLVRKYPSPRFVSARI